MISCGTQHSQTNFGANEMLWLPEEIGNYGGTGEIQGRRKEIEISSNAEWCKDLHRPE